MPKPSPCIGFCRIDEASRLCVGCARTGEEIAAWRDAPAAVLERIWAELPLRRAKLGVDLHRLGWMTGDIHSFISETVRGGSWVFGVYGAVAEFSVSPNEIVDLDLNPSSIVAATSRGAVRFELSDHVQALSLRTITGSRMAEAIILAVHRSRTGLLRPSGLTPLGLDLQGIRPKEGERLYDLGLGGTTAQFCIRTADAELAARLDAHIGDPWPLLLSNLGERIVEASPTRVVQSPVGRIEVYTPIPRPGGRSPAGPQTHLLPAHLATGRETPPGLELPDTLAACAIYYPAVGPPDLCR